MSMPQYLAPPMATLADLLIASVMVCKKKGGEVQEKNIPSILIGDGVRISTRSIILEGATAGPGNQIADEAVAIKDAPENTLVGGVSAKTIKTLPPRPQNDKSAHHSVPKPSKEGEHSHLNQQKMLPRISAITPKN